MPTSPIRTLTTSLVEPARNSQVLLLLLLCSARRDNIDRERHVVLNQAQRQAEHEANDAPIDAAFDIAVAARSGTFIIGSRCSRFAAVD